MRKDHRCTCKKIVCQLEGDTIIIMCRHCKKMLHIHTKGIVSMEYKLESQPIKFSAAK